VSAQVASPRRTYPPPPRSEPLWPCQLAIISAIVLQVTLPHQLRLGPRGGVPALEVALALGLVFATPRRLEGHHLVRRRIALSLTALVSLANAASLVLLTHELLHSKNPMGITGQSLIVSGTLIWLTNVIIFGLWYWELDRGGPGQRAEGQDGPPDLLYPQMSDDAIEPLDWRPLFVDYLYVSLTNAMAFSPTDTMPLSRGAKLTMALQSLISIVTIALVVSRAVNILPS
jgi:uncharacterized membrane protein